MTTTNYYDVVVIGMELGPLAAGALLAKRGFRVLIVGQDAPKDHYECLGYTFNRRPFMLNAFDSPATRRVLGELGIGLEEVRAEMLKLLGTEGAVADPGAGGGDRHRGDVGVAIDGVDSFELEAVLVGACEGLRDTDPRQLLGE